jgi:hypothetical protein
MAQKQGRGGGARKIGRHAHAPSNKLQPQRTARNKARNVARFLRDDNPNAKKANHDVGLVPPGMGKPRALEGRTRRISLSNNAR